MKQNKNILIIFMALILLMPGILGNVTPAKAVVKNKIVKAVVLPIIDYVGVGSKLLADETRSFTVSSKYTGNVQYRAFISYNNGNYIELTKGYTKVQNAKDLLSLPTTDKFKIGNYRLSIWVKKAGTNGVLKNKVGSYDSYKAIELSCKGAVVGTNGKGVISLRFDDYQNIFQKEIYPLLVERGLPASMSLISRFNTQQPWGMKTTWDQVRDWNKNGIEIWSHGTDHKNYAPKGYAGLYEEIVTSKTEIENQGIKVMGFALPGVAPGKGKAPLYNGLTKPSDYNSVEGRLIMKTYNLSEAYAYCLSGQRDLPTQIYHGISHLTVSDGNNNSLEKSIRDVDYAINNKTGLELMCHAGSLGLPGNKTLSEFTTLLDYIKTKWDDGSIEVLTPSSLNFADPSINTRLTLTSNQIEAWNRTPNSIRIIQAVGSKSGNEFISVHSYSNNTGVTQKINTSDKLRVSGEQFVFEGWARTNGEGIKSVQIKEIKLNKDIKVDSSWTRVRFVFGIPANIKTITLSLYGNAGETIDWDDVSIKKI